MNSQCTHSFAEAGSGSTEGISEEAVARNGASTITETI